MNEFSQEELADIAAAIEGIRKLESSLNSVDFGTIPLLGNCGEIRLGDLVPNDVEFIFCPA